jgi:hypothetical protein
VKALLEMVRQLPEGALRAAPGLLNDVGKVQVDLVSGNGPFAHLGEEVYDDYWMYYLTKDMAQGDSE